VSTIGVSCTLCVGYPYNYTIPRSTTFQTFKQNTVIKRKKAQEKNYNYKQIKRTAKQNQNSLSKPLQLPEAEISDLKNRSQDAKSAFEHVLKPAHKRNSRAVPVRLH